MRARTGLQATAVALLAPVLALWACSKPASLAAPQGQALAEQPDPGYRTPPQLLAGARSADGSVSLSGRAEPSWTIRMASPAGAEVDTTADGSGRWARPLGAVSEPTLYRLAEEAQNGQRIEAEGLIAVLPGSPAVALLRAGYGAEVLDGDKVGLRILAVDYDRGGGTVVSGRAKASAPVRVLVDGQPAADVAAGPDGRFSLVLPKPLDPGQHRLQLQTGQATAEASVAIAAPQPPKDGPYQVQAQPFGWRIDWTTAGGGPQTTLLLGG
jgi:hypothetical protein